MGDKLGNIFVIISSSLRYGEVEYAQKSFIFEKRIENIENLKNLMIFYLIKFLMKRLLPRSMYFFPISSLMENIHQNF